MTQGPLVTHWKERANKAEAALIEAHVEIERRHGIGGELLIARRERDAAKALLAEIAACPLWRHEWKARTPYLVMPDLLWERIQAYRQEVAK